MPHFDAAFWKIARLANGGLRTSSEKSETMMMEKNQETETDNFKYLGTEIKAEGDTLRAVKQRMYI